MQSSVLALDLPDEYLGFSRELNSPAGNEGQRLESFIAIEGMHCAACTLVVEKALSGVPGVSGVQVNGPAATARIEWSPGATQPSAWLDALARAGYGAVPAGDLLSAAPRAAAQRMMLWRWLVAGFCMMQVMMYATPAYVARQGEITPDIAALLGWASWVLTLPVVLFSCWPFFSSALRDLRNRTLGMDVPVALGIAIAFGASSIVTFDAGTALGHEVWYDSVTMFVFFLLSGRLLEQRLRDRTAGSLEALMRRLPATVLRRDASGAFERVSVRRLAPGDFIRVLPGEVIPADGAVVEGESRVDEALLTGEARPLARGVGEAVIAGSHNLAQSLLVRVERTGRDTRYAGIVALMEQASVEKPHLARMADRIAGPFLLAVLVAAAVAGLWWWTIDPSKALGVAIAVLIVTCPCALSLATPAATLAAAGALARRGVLVRRLQALEACASIDTVIFDKTGTLTHERMALVATCCRPGTTEAEALALASALARHSLHPASRAIVLAAQSLRKQGEVSPPPSGEGRVGARGRETASLDGQRAPTPTLPRGGREWTASSVEEIAGSGIRGCVSTADDQPTRELRLGSAAFCTVCPRNHRAPGAEAHLADERGWLATFELGEDLREDARPAVESLRSLGLNLELVSGDRESTVQQLAHRVGIGEALGGCSPEDKLAHIQLAQLKGQRVAMVGDGMNDGPVLARADVSIAMGQSVPLAQAHSDFIVPGGQVSAVPLLIEQARRTRAIVRQNLAWAAVYNAVCVPLAIAGAMPPWLAGLGMAASSLLVVANSARLARMPTER